MLVATLLAGCSASPPEAPAPTTSSSAQTSESAPEPRALPKSVVSHCGGIEGDATFAAVAAQDGSRVVVATFAPAKPTGHATVLLPQVAGGLCGWARYAGQLADAGALVVAVDPCGTGSTTCTQAYAGDRQLLSTDVLAWVRAEHPGLTSLTLTGASAGGSTALATGQEAGADAIIDLSGPAQWHGVPDAPQAAAGVLVPLLVVCAPDDTDVQPDVLRAAVEASPATPKTYLSAPEGHGWSMLTVSSTDPTLTPVGEYVRDWILGERRTDPLES